LNPTELTLAQAEKMPKEIREKYADDDSMVEAFTDAWVFLALQDGSGVTGQRIRTRDLAEYLKQNGWEATVANWQEKLTKAVTYPTISRGASATKHQTEDGKNSNLNRTF